MADKHFPTGDGNRYIDLQGFATAAQNFGQQDHISVIAVTHTAVLVPA